MPGKIRIGVSGWSYQGWRGDFYPDDLPQSEELSYAAERFPTLEINRDLLLTGETQDDASSVRSHSLLPSLLGEGEPFHHP